MILLKKAIKKGTEKYDKTGRYFILRVLKENRIYGQPSGDALPAGEKEDDGEKKLYVSVWPEPFNFFKTPEEQKQHAVFEFSGDGITDAIAWMNDRLFEYRK